MAQSHSSESGEAELGGLGLFVEKVHDVLKFGVQDVPLELHGGREEVIFNAERFRMQMNILNLKKRSRLLLGNLD